LLLSPRLADQVRGDPPKLAGVEWSEEARGGGHSIPNVTCAQRGGGAWTSGAVVRCQDDDVLAATCQRLDELAHVHGCPRGAPHGNVEVGRNRRSAWFTAPWQRRRSGKPGSRPGWCGLG